MKDDHRLAIRVAGSIQSRVSKLAMQMRNNVAHRDQHITAAMQKGSGASSPSSNGWMSRP